MDIQAIETFEDLQKIVDEGHWWQCRGAARLISAQWRKIKDLPANNGKELQDIENVQEVADLRNSEIYRAAAILTGCPSDDEDSEGEGEVVCVAPFKHAFLVTEIIKRPDRMDDLIANKYVQITRLDPTKDGRTVYCTWYWKRNRTTSNSEIK